MAWTSGTAANATDLLDRLLTFLTSDSALEAESGLWTLLRRDGFLLDTKRDLAELRGPGSSASDAIYIQLSLYLDPAAPACSLRVLGSQSWQSNIAIISPEGQPGSLQAGAGSLGIIPRIPLINSGISYWFIANGRRFIVVAKSATYWGSLYAGFILPYGTPTQYPYPLFIGANSATGDNYQSSSPQVAACAFWRTDGDSDDVYSAAIAGPAGGWIGANRYDVSNTGRIWPWASTIQSRKASPGRYELNMVTPLPDGSSPLLPAIVYDCATARPFTVWGELQGVFAVPGYGVAGGDTILIGGQPHLVVQQATSTNAARYAAIQLQ